MCLELEGANEAQEFGAQTPQNEVMIEQEERVHVVRNSTYTHFVKITYT